MSGRDSLPHFPAPEKHSQPPQSSPQQPQQPQMYPQQYQNLPPGAPVPGGYPTVTPVPGYQYAPGGYNLVPPGVDAIVYQQFKAADVNGVEQLSERELSAALVNSDYSRFDSMTVKLMVKMFDTDQYSALTPSTSL